MHIVSTVIGLIENLSWCILLKEGHYNTLTKGFDLQDEQGQYSNLSSTILLVPVLVFEMMLFASVIGETDTITIDLVDLSENGICVVEHMTAVVSFGKST